LGHVYLFYDPKKKTKKIKNKKQKKRTVMEINQYLKASDEIID